MKIHQVLIKDNKGNLIDETRYRNGLLYKQNRSYDMKICFEDFLERLKTTKQQVKEFKGKYILEHNLINDKQKWQRKNKNQ